MNLGAIIACALGLHDMQKLPRQTISKPSSGGKNRREAVGMFQFVCVRPRCEHREYRLRIDEP